MVVPAMAERCPTARLLGPGLLPAYRILINRQGLATVVPAREGRVFGLLWEIAPADERALDWFEGVERRLYRKRECDVTAKGATCRALLYEATERRAGAPRVGYLEEIIAAATACGLPEPYLAELRRLQGASGSHPAHSQGCG